MATYFIDYTIIFLRDNDNESDSVIRSGRSKREVERNLKKEMQTFYLGDKIKVIINDSYRTSDDARAN